MFLQTYDCPHEVQSETLLPCVDSLMSLSECPFALKEQLFRRSEQKRIMMMRRGKIQRFLCAKLAGEKYGNHGSETSSQKSGCTLPAPLSHRRRPPGVAAAAANPSSPGSCPTFPQTINGASQTVRPRGKSVFLGSRLGNLDEEDHYCTFLGRSIIVINFVQNQVMNAPMLRWPSFSTHT